mmetsp:Transcript_22654/g.73288  ORF Transcript_22654/g.73288 Transcript_22654/m.73288 type:complete len:223 (-) Transcript_22654:244-912(-)|eukprot:scaffold10474_cov122-Isochrysis_galbana.AAC.11
MPPACAALQPHRIAGSKANQQIRRATRQLPRYTKSAAIAPANDADRTCGLWLLGGPGSPLLLALCFNTHAPHSTAVGWSGSAAKNASIFLSARSSNSEVLRNPGATPGSLLIRASRSTSSSAAMASFSSNSLSYRLSSSRARQTKAPVFRKYIRASAAAMPISAGESRSRSASTFRMATSEPSAARYSSTFVTAPDWSSFRYSFPVSQKTPLHRSAVTPGMQ